MGWPPCSNLIILWANYGMYSGLGLAFCLFWAPICGFSAFCNGLNTPRHGFNTRRDAFSTLCEEFNTLHDGFNTLTWFRHGHNAFHDKFNSACAEFNSPFDGYNDCTYFSYGFKFRTQIFYFFVIFTCTYLFTSAFEYIGKFFKMKFFQSLMWKNFASNQKNCRLAQFVPFHSIHW